MADSKTTDLSAITTFSGDETFYVVEDDDGTPVSRKVTVENLAIGMAGLIGVYQAYDAVVSQNGTRTTSGEVARYCQIGKQVHVYGVATITDAGTAGNALTVSVPVAALAADRFVGAGWIYDTSATDQWNVSVRLATTTTLDFFATSTTNGNQWGSNPNLAVANGDIVYWSATYEAA